MMTVTDIFDALTAADRPCKRAVDLDRALYSLGLEARDGNIVARLLDLFIERQVFKIVVKNDATGNLKS